MLAAQIFKATNHLKSRGFGNLQTLTICSSVSRNQLHWKDTQTPYETVWNKMRESQLGTPVRKEGHSKDQWQFLTFRRTLLVSYSDTRSCIVMEHVFFLINFHAFKGLELDLSSKTSSVHLHLTLGMFPHQILFSF